jgi:hypothetical protein
MKLWGQKDKANFTAVEILQQLDKCAEDFTFPMLDNGYVYPVDSRLTAYRDNSRWAVLIEVIGFNFRGGGHNGITNSLHIYGNCLNFPPGLDNGNFLFITANSDEGETFDEEYQDSLNPNVHSMLLRDRKISISHDPEFYTSRDITLEDDPRIKIWEFIRAINMDYKELFHATEEEIRQRLPQDLPAVIRLNEWYHNDLAAGEKPSENETFKMIASVLETGNKNLYKPGKTSNNHWSNWPDGGIL